MTGQPLSLQLFRGRYVTSAMQWTDLVEEKSFDQKNKGAGK